MYVHTHWINKCVVNIFFVFHKCPRWMSINVPPNDVLRKGTHSRNADTFIYSHSFPSSLYGEKYSKSGYPLINAVEKCQPITSYFLFIRASLQRRGFLIRSSSPLFMNSRIHSTCCSLSVDISNDTNCIERLVQLKEASDDICEKISRDVPAIVEITFLSI